MAYKTLIYLGIFAVVSVLAYCLCPKKYRKLALLIPSLVAFAFFSKYAVVFLLATVVTTYFAARLIDKVPDKFNLEGLSRDEKKAQKAKIKAKKKRIFIVYVIINLGLLAVLKYFNFFTGTVCAGLTACGLTVSAPTINVIMPLGISYYTLQAIGYVVDVLRGKYKAEENIVNIALFISFFPQLNEGPFGRYDSLMPQMNKCENIKAMDASLGAANILTGLFKLFVIADRAAIIVSEVFSNYSSYSGLSVAFGVVAFTLQLFAEFSGYIDIAVGIAKLFGIDLQQNFDMPFIAENVGEFWRRWHISLGSWFKDYVFYPVSTSKPLKKITKKLPSKAGGMVMVLVSLFAVWFLTGLWHGASSKYIVYGLYYYALMVVFTLLSPAVNKLLEKCGITSDNKALKVFRILKTFLLVQLGMLIFRADNLSVFSKMFVSMFTYTKESFSVPGIETADLIALIVATVLLAAVGILKLKGISLKEKYCSLSPFGRYWVCFGIALATIIFGAYGLDYLPPDPIYGGF